MALILVAAVVQARCSPVQAVAEVLAESRLVVEAASPTGLLQLAVAKTLATRGRAANLGRVLLSTQPASNRSLTQSQTVLTRALLIEDHLSLEALHSNLISPRTAARMMIQSPLLAILTVQRTQALASCQSRSAALMRWRSPRLSMGLNWLSMPSLPPSHSNLKRLKIPNRSFLTKTRTLSMSRNNSTPLEASLTQPVKRPRNHHRRASLRFQLPSRIRISNRRPLILASIYRTR